MNANFGQILLGLLGLSVALNLYLVKLVKNTTYEITSLKQTIQSQKEQQVQQVQIAQQQAADENGITEESLVELVTKTVSEEMGKLSSTSTITMADSSKYFELQKRVDQMTQKVLDKANEVGKEKDDGGRKQDQEEKIRQEALRLKDEVLKACGKI